VKELESCKAEMETFRAELEGKEKQIRQQVIQVKQLRRSLKEMALGGVHFTTPAMAQNGPPLHHPHPSGDISTLNHDLTPPASKGKKWGEEKSGTRHAIVNPILARLLLKVDVNSKKKKVPNGLAMKERSVTKGDKMRHALEVSH